MKITYTPNPLNCVIELDEHERKEFRYKLIIEELEDAMHSASFHLNPEDKYYKPEQARAELDMEYYFGQEFQKRIDELLNYYLEDLKGPHGGDCTCVPCSCSKCHAEGMLGIDTIQGLGKHSAYKINDAFEGLFGERTIDQAIKKLEHYKPKAAWKGWEAHADRWKAEAAHALEWLKKYRDTHFKGE